MTIELRYHPLVPVDISQGISHYEAISDDLANRFRSHVEDALSRIATSPGMHAIAFENVHFIRIHRFPFLVQYRMLASTPFVLGVFYASADPESWRQRTDGNAG